MPTKRQLSREELEKHLSEQLQFIEASAAAYDAGFEGEAKRLAVSIRILCHNTQLSKSLLGQLGLLAQFYDTAIPLEQASMMTHGGLVWISAKEKASKYIAMLDDVPIIKWSPFLDWWTNPIFRDLQKRELSRKALITTAANQDGGAHVDPALDIVYSDLANENSLGWVSGDGVTEELIPGAEKAAIRQIAHEVLKTFRKDYTKRPLITGDLILGGATVVEGNPPVINGIPNPGWEPPGGWRKTGRNKPCPCGSGTKYKRCHGKWR